MHKAKKQEQTRGGVSDNCERALPTQHPIDQIGRLEVHVDARVGAIEVLEVRYGVVVPENDEVGVAQVVLLNLLVQHLVGVLAVEEAERGLGAHVAAHLGQGHPLVLEYVHHAGRLVVEPDHGVVGIDARPVLRAEEVHVVADHRARAIPLVQVLSRERDVIVHPLVVAPLLWARAPLPASPHQEAALGILAQLAATPYAVLQDALWPGPPKHLDPLELHRHGSELGARCRALLGVLDAPRERPLGTGKWQERELRALGSHADRLALVFLELAPCKGAAFVASLAGLHGGVELAGRAPLAARAGLAELREAPRGRRAALLLIPSAGGGHAPGEARLVVGQRSAVGPPLLVPPRQLGLLVGLVQRVVEPSPLLRDHRLRAAPLCHVLSPIGVLLGEDLEDRGPFLGRGGRRVPRAVPRLHGLGAVLAEVVERLPDLGGIGAHGVGVVDRGGRESGLLPAAAAPALIALAGAGLVVALDVLVDRQLLGVLLARVLLVER
mmetsp:Transcript_30988/g.98932  ORF Transcript_30988/g.98932 Transcript_30988/m.98932 type:complete len:497 (+) Transcript_30988:435-1925(+)